MCRVHRSLLVSGLFLLIGPVACDGPSAPDSGGDGDGDGEDAGDGGGDGDEQEPEPLVTAVGQPVGEPSGGTVGPEGGELSTPDGRLSITVPAGAVAEEITLTIQPIEAKAPGAVAVGYRLDAEGVEFAAPVELRFAFDDADVEGSAPEVLDVAFQTEEGTWQLADTLSLHADEQAVTATTSTFSDWTLVQRFRLRPVELVVYTGQQGFVEGEMCFQLLGERNARLERPVVGVECNRLGLSGGLFFKNWSVNGTVGGNAQKGTILDGVGRGRYQAPQVRPTPDVVTAGVTVSSPAEPTLTAHLTSKIRILADRRYVGQLDATMTNNGVTTVSGQVGWTVFEQLPDVERYLPNGVLDASITYQGCDTVTAQLPIDTGSPESPGGTLTLYLEGNPYGRTYAWGLSTVPTNLTYLCGDDPKQAVTIETSVAILVGHCESLSLVPYTNIDQLDASYSCGLLGLTATWNFDRED